MCRQDWESEWVSWASSGSLVGVSDGALYAGISIPGGVHRLLRRYRTLPG